MEIFFRPIERWPTVLTSVRRRSKFKTPYSATLSLLDKELRHLAAKNVVLQVAMKDADIRLDGCPRANATASNPGVILAFDSKFGPLSYPCDTFNLWEDNLRAIALALESLRQVERYGVTRRGEQYQGWQCLTGPTGGSMTIESAREFLNAYRSNGETIEDAYRTALGMLHPDRNGGDEGPFKKLQEAKGLLGL